MKKQEVKVELVVGLIPEPNTTYWYIRGNMISHDFKVAETIWIGGLSDSLRLAKGNVYLTEKDANEVCIQLNERLNSIVDAISGLRQKERIEEEKKRRKEEAAKRKAERDKNLTEEDKKLRKERIHFRALRYEANKMARKARTLHPDIID